MTRTNAVIAFLSALAGGLAVALFAHPVGQIAASKTERLGGAGRPRNRDRVHAAAIRRAWHWDACRSVMT